MDLHIKTWNLVAMWLCNQPYLHAPNNLLAQTCSTVETSQTRCDQQHGGFIWTQRLSGSQHRLARYRRCCYCGILCIAAPSRPCLLRFQGCGPTCSSCWAADWLAAALHEGWVKWQTGPHDPAQPESCLFQELFLFFNFQRLQPSFKSWTTYHTMFAPAVRKQPFNSPCTNFNLTMQLHFHHSYFLYFCPPGLNKMRANEDGTLTPLQAHVLVTLR